MSFMLFMVKKNFMVKKKYEEDKDRRCSGYGPGS